MVLLSLSYWVGGLRWDGIDYQELVLEPIYFLNFSLNNIIELKTCPVYCGITTRLIEDDWGMYFEVDNTNKVSKKLWVFQHLALNLYNLQGDGDACAWDLMWRGRTCVPDCTCYHHLPELHQISLPWSVRIPSQIKPTMSPSSSWIIWKMTRVTLWA